MDILRWTQAAVFTAAFFFAQGRAYAAKDRTSESGFQKKECSSITFKVY